MNKIWILFILILIIPIVSAQPPFITTTNINGLTIDALIYSPINQNQDFTFHLHTYNITSGLNMSNATTKCFLHLYNSSGNHLIRQSPMGWDGNGDWELTISKGNFSKTGDYALEVWCISGVVGGSERLFFEVTPTGQTLSDSEINLFKLGIYVLIVLSLFFFALGYIMKMPQIKILFMSLTAITLMFLVGIINSNINTWLYKATNYVNVYNSYYILLTIIVGAAVIGLLIWLVYYSFDTFSKMRGRVPED